MSLLEVKDLTRVFGGLTALNKFCFRLEDGEISGIVGPNGAGKTTALNLISGLDSATSGTVLVNGSLSTDMKSHEYVKLGIARTYQNIRLFLGMSVLDHVIVGLDSRRTTKFFQMLVPNRKELLERKKMRELGMEILSNLSIDHLAEVEATTLSYGHQRRLEIARALATNPKLLLLDEPTAGMNQTESQDVRDTLLKLNSEGIALLIVEHNIKFVRDLCKSVTVLNFGQELITGTPEEVFSSMVVREAYLGKAQAERVKSFDNLRQGVSRDFDMSDFSEVEV
mgnify:FL=1